jgi:hypothetical protein
MEEELVGRVHGDVKVKIRVYPDHSCPNDRSGFLIVF